MNYIYITGTSRGIGKAIAEQILAEGNNKVIGIARGQSIEHENYEHITLDLNDLDKVKNFDFEAYDDIDKVALINNAGTLGDVKHAGSLDNDNVIKTYNVNITAPTILINKFLHQYRELAADKIVLNVTSGAAHRPMDGWNLYCSSKAWMDMYTEVIAKEQELDQLAHPFHIFAVTPSIVDTPMQEKIRSSEEEHFTQLEKFKEYKKENMLQDPQEVGKKFARIIREPENFQDIIFSVRDFEA